MNNVEKIRALQDALNAAVRWIDHTYAEPIKDVKALDKMEKDKTIDDRYKADIHLIRCGLEIGESTASPASAEDAASENKSRRELANIITTHRKKSYFTCEGSCWCWDVEKVAMKMEHSAKQ